MAISVGSVEVDVVPNTRGIYGKLKAALEPAGEKAGADAGRSAGNAFGPAMQAAIGDLGARLGRQIATQITGQLRGSLRDGITQGGRAARPAAVRQGDESGGAFGRSFQNRVRAAMASLPRADVRLSDTGFNADLARLRARLETLSNKRIGVDVEASRALAEVEALDAELVRLGAQHPDIQVRMDTARARGELDRLRAEIAAVDANDVDVDVDIDTSRAVSAILQIGVALAAVAALPALPVLAAGIGSVAAAATAAAAGVGALATVAVPAVLDIRNALEAQKAAQDAAATATARGGQAAAQAASRALQLQGAQRSLAAAERNGARQVAQAQQAVRQARQAAADAAVQAAERQQQAARQVQDAERALADAQQDARRAQQDLTQARRDAAEELQDLNNRLADARLSERDAEISLAEATAQRDAVLRDANATELDRQRALLAYDQAVQRLREQRTETARLADETEQANAAGVEGSETVRQAQERLADAQEQVADRTQAVRDAQVEAARTQVETARQVAEAQERVSDATANVASARQAAADAVASAQQQIASAQLSAAGASDQAAVAQQKYEAALAAMTPATRETYNSFLSLRDAVREWSRSLQPAVMPIFTRALDGLKNSLPGLTPFVTGAADAIKGLQDRISRGFDSEGWRRFRDDLADATGPAITGIGTALLNIGRGLGGIVDAFLPHIDTISGRLQSVSGRFADWGSSLRGSPEFENFLDYSAEMAPILAEALGDIVSAGADLGHALSPLSGPVLQTLGALAQAVSWLATTMPGLVQVMYLAFVATRAWTLATVLAAAAQRAWAVATALFNAIMSANPIVLVTLAIAALVAGVIYAYTHFDWFRSGVQAAWDGIKTAALAAWNGALKPVFDAFAQIVTWLWTYSIKPQLDLVIWEFQLVSDAALWLWRNAIKPAINGIATLVEWVWKYSIKPQLDLVMWEVRRVADVFKWLWREVIKPVAEWIADKIEWVWEHGIKPSFDAIKDGVGAVGDAFETAKDAIKTAWDALKNIAKDPVNFIIDTVYNDGIRTVWNTVVGAFGGHRLDKVETLATGGVLPGYTPGRDVHLAALSGGEAVMRPEWTRAVGPDFVYGMNAIARRDGIAGVREAMAGIGMGLPGFDLGGIFEGIGDVASGAWDIVKDGARWLRSTFQDAVLAGAEAIINPLIDLIPGGGGFKDLLKGGARSMLHLLLGAGERGGEEATPHVSYRPSAGVEQWRPVVLQALREAGQSSGLADTTLRRMRQESGGNPTIVNRWDSNWERGTPSVGLMQVIRPTFERYAGRYRSTGPFSYGVSVDPLANVYSSMKYALSRYGSLSAAYDRPGGYDAGGWLRPGQLGLNGLSRPEAVLTPRQWSAVSSLAERGAQTGDLAVHVYVGDREITDIVRTEVTSSNAALATALLARRR